MIKKILFTLLLFCTTIVFSQKSLSEVSVAPNPFTSNTNMRFTSDNEQIILLKVKNILGKIVYEKQFKAIKGKNVILFSKNDLKSGMYIYVLQNNKELISKRFVIK